VNRILKPVTYVLAAVYFLVDAVFMTLSKPVSNWIAKHLELRKLRAWIRSLRPYPSLALFSVPVVILEPIKPLAAYLAATGQILSGALTLIIGEVLKLVLVEHLFSLTRDKLMKIPAFAWAYTKFRQARAWIEATEVWRTMRSLSKAARDYLTHVRAMRGRRFANVEDRQRQSALQMPYCVDRHDSWEKAPDPPSPDRPEQQLKDGKHQYQLGGSNTAVPTKLIM
jgi:hypothetical protein